jgi:antirestriction protein ArdC
MERHRRSKEEREEISRESLSRARNGESAANFTAIYHGFVEKGISEDDIRPRENVFTYNAWKALGRQVRKGEHGVRVMTYITNQKKKDDGTLETFKRPWAATVFHITQTDPISN